MASIIKPNVLSKGGMVSVIAPSEPVRKSDVDRIKRFFEKEGFGFKAGKNILKKVGDYVAGTDEERAADFNEAFSDKEVKAVFVAVGGFGASQILGRIDFEKIKKNPKIFAGYSDATTLQLAIFAKTGLVTFHSPNAIRLPEFKPTGYTMANFWDVITEVRSNIVIKPQSMWGEVIAGKAEGVLFGGNLSCLARLLGTPWDPIAMLAKYFGKDTKYIFFWEEVSDQFSEIMRNLWQIRNTGFFENVSGMIVGKLTDVAEKDYKDFPTKKSLFRDLAVPYGFPMIYGADFGHDVPQATVPIGVRAFMDTSKSYLEILEPGVIDA